MSLVNASLLSDKYSSILIFSLIKVKWNSSGIGLPSKLPEIVAVTTVSPFFYTVGNFSHNISISVSLQNMPTYGFGTVILFSLVNQHGILCEATGEQVVIIEVIGMIKGSNWLWQGNCPTVRGKNITQACDFITIIQSKMKIKIEGVWQSGLIVISICPCGNND